jgi:hypothetical protein
MYVQIMVYAYIHMYVCMYIGVFSRDFGTYHMIVIIYRMSDYLQNVPSIWYISHAHVNTHANLSKFIASVFGYKF